MGKIFVKDLKMLVMLGVHAHERIKPQEILVNLELDYDSNAAVVSDRIQDVLDYEKVVGQIIERCKHSTFFLIEKLSQEILDEVMSDARVLRAKIEIEKPQALKKLGVHSVSFQLEQSR